MLVYKYVPYPIIVETGRFRFSQLDALNDPFELRSDLKALKAALKKRVLNSPEGKYHMSHMIDFEKNTFLDEIIKPALQEVTDNFKRNILLLCLTQNRNNLLMWSHYAKSHHGMVIGFDSENEFFHNAHPYISRLYPVNYSDDRLEFPASLLEGNVSFEEFRNLGLCKSRHWEYEEEIRMFASPNAMIDTGITDEFNIPVLVYDFPPESLREIMFGPQMERKDKRAVGRTALAKYPNIELFEAKLSLSKFDLDIVSFNV